MLFRVYWGLYTEAEYREYIARPGDGNRDYIHDTNFNKAQAKVAEALQVLIKLYNPHFIKKRSSVFPYFIQNIVSIKPNSTKYCSNKRP